ncbi:MAG: hypothetical protein ACRD68_09035, partial [Pyrinomonadaceae bacterium]
TMRSSSTAEFCKQKTCPSAEVLILYNKTSLARDEQRKVAVHLVLCDFCGAEIQLLARHLPARDWEGMPETVGIPSALRRLADDLMANHTRRLSIFTEMILEKEPLTLTDA